MRGRPGPSPGSATGSACTSLSGDCEESGGRFSSPIYTRGGTRPISRDFELVLNLFVDCYQGTHKFDNIKDFVIRVKINSFRIIESCI